jgi:hypothetical protein
MRKLVGNSEISKKDLRTDPCVFKGGPVSALDRTTVGQLDANRNPRTHRSSPDGSHFFNGEPHMRNRFQLSFWGLRVDAVGIFAITAAVLVVLVFALLLALRF